MEGEIEEVNGVTLWNGEHFNNGEISFPPDVKRIEFRVASFEGSSQRYSLGLTTTLDILETHEAFQLVNAGDECFTFDDFRPNVLTNLDGFCGNYTAQIQSNQNSVSSDYDLDIALGTLNDLSSSENCDSLCSIVIADYTVSDPVPCGCKIVKIKVTLEPCWLPGKELCLDIIMTMGAMTCCECDVREVNNNQN